MNKHTPGPWEATAECSITGPRCAPSVFWDETDVEAIAVRRGESVIAWVAALNGTTDELMPDAILIAAAPELLDALKAMVTDEKEDPCYYDHHGYCQAHGLQPKGECYMEMARAAIAKAEGAA